MKKKKQYCKMFQNKEKSLFILNKEKFLFILDKEKNQNKEMPFVSHLLFKRGLTVYTYIYIYMLRQIHQIADLTKSAMGIAEFVKSATDCRFCQIGKFCCRFCKIGNGLPNLSNTNDLA